jgi:hypothetical protein
VQNLLVLCWLHLIVPFIHVYWRTDDGMLSLVCSHVKVSHSVSVDC